MVGPINKAKDVDIQNAVQPHVQSQMHFILLHKQYHAWQTKLPTTHHLTNNKRTASLWTKWTPAVTEYGQLSLSVEKQTIEKQSIWTHGILMPV